MKALLFTEGGRKFGFGHLSRCLALYQAFRERNIKVKIIVDGDATVDCFLKGIKHKKISWIKNQKNTINQLKNIDIVAIDSYTAPLDLYEKISKLVKIAVYIDDYKRLNYPKGIVVNPSIYGDKLHYPKREGISYLLGSNYIILKKEFWKVPKKKVNKEIKKVLITLGGKNDSDFINKLINFLKKRFNFAFTAVDTENNTLKTKEMLNLMLKTDVCISGGGQTTYELARVGVPTIGVCLADNQRGNLNGLKRKGFLRYAGNYREKKLFGNIAIALKFFQPQAVRDKKSIIGKNLIDAKGAKRIAQKTLITTVNDNQDFYLRRANKNDCRDLWLWRNNSKVRKYSFNQKAVSYKDHRFWFGVKLKDKTTKIYIAESKKKGKIVQVRFEINLAKQAYINSNLNPKFFNKGLGSQVIKSA
ncbi:MAG: hypothetical protein KBB01_02000, partial [Candidatus Omnitrophica bacterium]|nr:hypothetical protein [Candidatus Omnitrophota bacterium]